MTSQTLDRISLACEQLEIAMDLFLSGQSYVAALTLAGAAEEILGQALKHRGEENAMQSAYESTSSFHRMLHGKELKWQDFADGENYARNAAKHMRDPSETSITTDLRHAAQWMIVRACSNSDRLGIARTDRMSQFENWFYEYEVGV